MAAPAKRSGGWSASDMKFYFTLSQIGVEMAAPIGLGVLADHWLGTGPWITVVMAVLGPVGGIWHMLLVVNAHERDEPAKPASWVASAPRVPDGP